MSALSTPSAWLVQTTDVQELSAEDLFILTSGIFNNGNITFERREDNSLVIRLPYSIKLENLVDRFGDYKEVLRIVPVSPHHNEREATRFLQLVARRRVYPTSPGKQSEEQQPGASNSSSLYREEEEYQRGFRLHLPNKSKCVLSEYISHQSQY